MKRLEKSQSFNLKKADAAADIELINKYSRKVLKPEEVYCFSVRLCDNEVDRDSERFTDSALEALSHLFVGKTGLFDHQWTAEGQIARLYRVEVVTTGKRNSLGEPLKILQGCAYMLKNAENQPLIEAIEGGILKEVSVGCAMKECRCSICGEPSRWNGCKNGHLKGEQYDGKLCFGELSEPTDAYEFSFVAVPAQRGAGVTKSAKGTLQDIEQAFSLLITADLKGYEEQKEALERHFQEERLAAVEKKKREDILLENQKFLSKERDEKK